MGLLDFKCLICFIAYMVSENTIVNDKEKKNPRKQLPLFPPFSTHLQNAKILEATLPGLSYRPGPACI